MERAREEQGRESRERKDLEVVNEGGNLRQYRRGFLEK